MAENKPPPPAFALRASDKQSDCWTLLKKHLQERIGVLHLSLENAEEGPAAMKVRGQLAEVKRLLSLDSNQPPGV
jgi:hypothetical protein